MPLRDLSESLVTHPAPPGGWDVAGQSCDVDGLDELRASGAILRDVWRRDESGALILQVAAGDVDAVERVLGAQLPRRLSVVPSRYTAAQLREVESMFAAHAAEWGFERWSHRGLDAQGQPYADINLGTYPPDPSAPAPVTRSGK